MGPSILDGKISEKRDEEWDAAKLFGMSWVSVGGL